LAEFEHLVSDVTIIPSSGGAFEVVVDGELVYSKKATGRHAEPEEILAALRERTN
jgi:selenoprotein W-related protein